MWLISIIVGVGSIVIMFCLPPADGGEWLMFFGGLNVGIGIMGLLDAIRDKAIASAIQLMREEEGSQCVRNAKP